MRYVTEKDPVKGYPPQRAKVLGECDNFYWVQFDESPNSAPFTSPKELWEDVQPEVGDSWAYSANSVSHYRVVGVDKKRGVFNMVPLAMDEKRTEPVVPRSGQQESWMSSRVLYVWPLPEEAMVLVSRPE